MDADAGVLVVVARCVAAIPFFMANQLRQKAHVV